MNARIDVCAAKCAVLRATPFDDHPVSFAVDPLRNDTSADQGGSTKATSTLQVDPLKFSASGCTVGRSGSATTVERMHVIHQCIHSRDRLIRMAALVAFHKNSQERIMQRVVRRSGALSRAVLAHAGAPAQRHVMRHVVRQSLQFTSAVASCAQQQAQSFGVARQALVRAFSASASGDESSWHDDANVIAVVYAQGLRALKKAKELIENDDLESAMGYLGVAANDDIGEAQYLLGSLLLDDDEDDEHGANDEEEGDDEDEKLVLDVETKRRQNYRADDPQDIRSIRKSARKAYKEYLQANSSAKPIGRMGKKGKTSIVQHATVNELDRAFGTTLKQFLDPKIKVRPLKDLQDGSELEQLEKADSTKAVEWIRRAADNKYESHREAHVQLGNLCLSQEPPLAFAASEWYSRAASARDPNPHPDALYNLGLMLYDGVEDAEPPFPASKSASIPYFVKAAEVGDASAQFFMGHLLHHGDEELGIEANMDSALMLINKAAEKGHGGAHFYLAQLYRSGDPVAKVEADQPKFLEHLDAAIELEDEDALFCMADIYFHGSDEFPEDLEQARRFYLAAADAGSADAFCCLGTIYYQGLGVKKDYERAFYYYQEAADRHSMEAWKNLAEMYSFGRGVPRNEATAESILKMLRKVQEEQQEE
ncbi:Extracellular protein, partial [Globisporangium splendens]